MIFRSFSVIFCKVKLSIIIPVYCVEATLERCLQSVVGQTYSDFEVLLVDDGSPDRCPQLCDEWAARDSRISVIHKQNGGLSDARNAGIDAARGDCLTFVDSDDYLAHDTYEHVVPLLAESDIVEFPIFWHYGASEQLLLSFPPATYTSMQHYWLQARVYQHTFACNKVYRRELFRDVRFPKGRVFEDAATLPHLLAHASQVSTTNRGLYYYCSNPQGISSTARGSELSMLLESHLDTMQRWTDSRYYMHVLNIQMDVCQLTGADPLLPSVHISPFSTGLSSIQRIKATALNVLGIRRLCKLNKRIHQLMGRHL